MPRAAMAVTRHQRDRTEAPSTTGLDSSPRLLAATRAAKPMRNMGTGGPDPPASPACRRATRAMVNTTGSSMVTRSSFT